MTLASKTGRTTASLLISNINPKNEMNMKKIISWGMMLAAAFTLTNCAKEIEDPNQELESVGYPFEIIASTVDTKTVNDGMSTKWATKDQINLFHAVCDDEDYKNNGAFTVNEVESGNFKGELCEKLDPQEEYDWYAFYPYKSQIVSPKNEAGWAYIGNKNGITQEGGYGKTAHLASSNCPLYGVKKAVPAADTPSIEMQHLSSVVAINVTNMTDEPLTVSSATFTANEPIVGSFYIDFSGAPTYTPSEEQYVSNAATVNVKGGTPLVKEESGVLYLVVKPFTAAKDSKLYLSVNGYEKELTMPQDVTFTAGKIKTLNFKYDKAPTPHVTWDLTTASYESASTEKVVWISEFVNLTLEKGGSTTAANNYLADEHSRVYKDQIMTFDPLGKYQIESIEFAVVSGYDDEFEKATWVNGEPVTSGNTVVVTPTDGHAKVSATIGAATRFTSITVYYSYDENFILPTVESIAVDGQTSELMQGSEFVFGGTVTATYTNGETTDVTSVAQFSGYDMSTPGEQTVEVSYTEGEKTVKTTYQLTVLAADSDVTDKLNLAFTGQTGTSYGTWSGKKASSDAVYAGNSAGDKSSIQLRSNNSNSGIVTTTSGGYAKKVVVTWQSETADGRTLNIYGKNTAYTAATDLYNATNQGTLLGTIKKGTSTEFVIPGNYQYIGLRSASGAMYISEIQITWSSSPIALESIAVSGQKTDYYVGDSFVAPTVTATYSDGSSSVVSGAEFSGYDMSQEGEQTVTVSYTQGDVTKETTYTINVNAKPALVSIAIDGTPKTEYTVGDSFVAPSVKATYSDNSSSPVSGAEFTGYDLETAGNQTVNVSYTENGITKSTSYDIVVKAAQGGVKKFVKVTSAPTDWSGTYLIVWSDNKARSKVNSKDLVSVSNSVLSISNNEIVADSNTAKDQVVITAKSGGYTIQLSDGQYLYVTNANQVNAGASSKASTMGLKWTSSGVEITGVDSANNTRYLYQNGTYYRMYKKNASYKLPTLYKLVD